MIFARKPEVVHMDYRAALFISAEVDEMTARNRRLINPTYKTRRDGTKKAAFAVYFGLTPEQVATVERLSAVEGMSGRKWLRKIALDAVMTRIG